MNSGIPREKVIAFSKTFNKYGSDEKFEENRKTLREEEIINSEMKVLMQSEEFARNLQEEFKNCVKMHLMIKSFCNSIESFFSPVLLPIILFATYFLIFIAYSLIFVSPRRIRFDILNYLFVLGWSRSVFVTGGRIFYGDHRIDYLYLFWAVSNK